MAEKFIIIIEGLGTPGTSPVDALSPMLSAAIPDARVFTTHWKIVERGEFDLSGITTGDKVFIVGHSLGGYAAIWLAAVLSNIDLVCVDMILIDPVTGDEQHAWAQIGAPALKLPPNVTSCTCYLRTAWTWIPPYHQGLATPGGAFLNVQVKDTDHNSIVQAVADDVVEFARKVLV